MKRRTWFVIAALLVLIVLYVAAPVAAGMFGIGDRWGPRIYVTSFHEVLYLIGWEMTTWHEDGKPRIAIGQRPEWRPWFYGLSCRNDDVRRIPPGLDCREGAP
jgi:hypothetical protein